MPTVTLLHGDCLAVLPTLPDHSVQCCVTSPPYWGLRDYGHAEQLGLEITPEAYVANLVAVFAEVKRVLADDGTLWLNLGDSYASAGGRHDGRTDNQTGTGQRRVHEAGAGDVGNRTAPDGLKPKDLCGIPWRVAFALQADGWYLRSDIIWCLSGGTWVYVRTQKGVMPMTVKDMARLDPATVELWNGEKWTRLLGTSKSPRRGDEVEMVLRSGERISCTPGHRFPTSRGLLTADEIRVGDCLVSCRLPSPENPKDCAIDEDAAWFAGLYVAEGSMAGDTIQIAGHTKEEERWDRVQRIATKYGGTATRTVDGNNMEIRVYGKVLVAILAELVTGRTSHDKGFSPVVWRYSDAFLAAMVDGYLAGDGGYDAAGNRWRLGFCRNYNMERDLRTACARLGYTITLNLASVPYDGKQVPAFRGELRKERRGHHNERDRNEVVQIRKARCRYVYDLGVADEPHLFALASGVLTHNSKPNPMPESVTDRPTRSHEYLFLLTKSARYYYDAKAVAEPATNGERWHGDYAAASNRSERNGRDAGHDENRTDTRNKRDVWTIPAQPFHGAHFAVMPEALVTPCVRAGSRPGDTVIDPFAGAGTVPAVAYREGRSAIGIELNPDYLAIANARIAALTPPLL